MEAWAEAEAVFSVRFSAVCLARLRGIGFTTSFPEIVGVPLGARIETTGTTRLMLTRAIPERIPMPRVPAAASAMTLVAVIPEEAAMQEEEVIRAEAAVTSEPSLLSPP